MSKLKTLGPGKNCGGPLICNVCAMNYAIIYKEAGHPKWSAKYRQHAKRLANAKLKKREKTDEQSGANNGYTLWCEE